MNTYNSKISSKKKKISEYSIDETIIKDGSEYIWLWVPFMETTKTKEII
jgi:transposase-like protein